MLPMDKARIGSFSNRIQVDPRDFTSDRDELLRILQTELQEEGPTLSWNSVNVGITALLHQDGRRVILVFTDGLDSPGNGSRNNSLNDVLKRAEDENVMVYAIGFSGGASRTAAPAPVVASAAGAAAAVAAEGGVTGPDPGLPKIAASTGGGYFELTTTRDLADTFKRVADELHHQYALGFAPTVLDGKRHSLEVRVARPGAAVSARKNYVASKG